MNEKEAFETAFFVLRDQPDHGWPEADHRRWREATKYFEDRLKAMDDQGRTDTLLLAANRIGELRAAVTAARDVMLGVIEVDSEAAWGDASGAAAHQAQAWLDRWGPLGVRPEIEVEDDDDPEDTPVEGEIWVKESEGVSLPPLSGQERWSP